MNWRQTFTTATPQEHADLLVIMVRRLERRRRLRRIFRAVSPVLPERRASTRRFHFVGGDPRQRRSLYRLYLFTVSVILFGLSLGALLMVFHAPPVVSGMILFGYDALMVYIVIAKPYLRLRPQIPPSAF